MPANKRQHYVPQNYLREFSPDKINIGVFHIESGKWYENAPINGQAQHSFFYGVDNNLEKELSELEGLLADNRKSIINRESTKPTLILDTKTVFIIFAEKI